MTLAEFVQRAGERFLKGRNNPGECAPQDNGAFNREVCSICSIPGGAHQYMHLSGVKGQ